MMQSNNPYQKVDDGIGGGLIGGAAIGSAVAYGAYAGTRMARGKQLTNARSQMSQARELRNNVMRNASPDIFGVMKGNMAAQGSRIAQDSARAGTKGGAGGMHNKLFGGTKIGAGKMRMGRRTAATAAASVIGGALLGGVIDGANN